MPSVAHAFLSVSIGFGFGFTALSFALAKAVNLLLSMWVLEEPRIGLGEDRVPYSGFPCQPEEWPCRLLA